MKFEEANKILKDYEFNHKPTQEDKDKFHKAFDSFGVDISFDVCSTCKYTDSCEMHVILKANSETTSECGYYEWGDKGVSG